MRAFSYTAVFPLIALLASGVRADSCVGESPSDYARADLKHAQEQLKGALALKRSESSAVKLQRALDELNAQIKEGVCTDSSPEFRAIPQEHVALTVHSPTEDSAKPPALDSTLRHIVPVAAETSAISVRTPGIHHPAEQAYALGRVVGSVVEIHPLPVSAPDQWKTIPHRRRPPLVP